MKTIASNPNQIPFAVSKGQFKKNHSNLRREKFLLLAILGAGWLCTLAHADALTGYYTAVAAGDPDFYGGLNAPNIGIMGTGNVQSQLGPNGLPVLSAAGMSLFGSSSDMNATTHELLWWSPGLDPYVSKDPIPVQVDSMPMVFGYPNAWNVTGQSSDSSYFRSVHWQGTFNLGSAGPISLTMSVDDDAWLFIDGTLAMEDHYGYTANANPTMSAGTHSIDIFYDDRFPVNDAFNLSSSVALSPVPEPGAITLFAAGAGLLACAKRRQRQVARS
jgi:hypothetical protein